MDSNGLSKDLALHRHPNLLWWQRAAKQLVPPKQREVLDVIASLCSTVSACLVSENNEVPVGEGVISGGVAGRILVAWQLHEMNLVEQIHSFTLHMGSATQTEVNGSEERANPDLFSFSQIFAKITFQPQNSFQLEVICQATLVCETLERATEQVGPWFLPTRNQNHAAAMTHTPYLRKSQQRIDSLISEAQNLVNIAHQELPGITETGHLWGLVAIENSREKYKHSCAEVLWSLQLTQALSSQEN